MENKKHNLVRIYPLISPQDKQDIKDIYKSNQDIFKSEGDFVRTAIKLLINKYKK